MRGSWCVVRWILVSQFRVLRIGTRSEIRPDNMYQPLWRIVTVVHVQKKVYIIKIEFRNVYN